MKRIALAVLVTVAFAAALAGSAAAGNGITISSVVDVSQDQLSQNETPIAINPANPANMITGANDWNYNDGCAVNTTKRRRHVDANPAERLPARHHVVHERPACQRRQRL
jgi:hypothetical protein